MSRLLLWLPSTTIAILVDAAASLNLRQYTRGSAVVQCPLSAFIDIRSAISKAEGSQGAVHVLGSPRVEVDGDRASGECVWAAVSLRDDGTPRVAVGRHLDELVREDGRWRFAVRKGLLDVGAVG
jgi:hypothetical protein